MNNGRDCPHGRQVGKCDTCDLIKAELELERVTSERDALAAQVSALKNHLSIFGKTETLEDAVQWEDDISFLINQPPQQHLAAHDAEVSAKAVEDFIEFMYASSDCQLCSNSLDIANKYAARLRAKSGA